MLTPQSTCTLCHLVSAIGPFALQAHWSAQLVYLHTETNSHTHWNLWRHAVDGRLFTSEPVDDTLGRIFSLVSELWQGDWCMCTFISCFLLVCASLFFLSIPLFFFPVSFPFCSCIKAGLWKKRTIETEFYPCWNRNGIEFVSEGDVTSVRECLDSPRITSSANLELLGIFYWMQ